MLILVICSTFFTCRDRDPVNPLDPDNPTTHGQAYTIQATATGIGRVVVHWRRIDEPQVKGYRLYRSISGGGAAFSPIANVSDSQYVDARLQPRTYCDYYYRILWEDGRELHQSPTSGDSTFDAPTGFIIRTVTRTRVELQWNDLSWLDNYARCRIYRRVGTTYSVYDSTSSNQYIDTQVDTGVTYRYKLLAVATGGTASNFSDEVYATPGNRPPNPPTLISPADSSANSPTAVTLSWTCTDPDNDPLSYDVYLDKSNPPISIVSANQISTNLLRNRLDAGSTYYWKVIAKDSLGGSTPSAVWMFTTPAYAQTWNMSDDYSTTNNPNGVWSYGRKWSADGSTFDLFTTTWGTSGWYMGNIGNGGPGIQAGVDLWAKANANGLPCVRWTSPQSGVFNLISTFTGADSRGVSVIVYIALNDSVIFSDSINAYLDSTTYSSGNFHCKQGDYIDFLIEWNANGGVTSEADWTIVSGTINKEW
jgi:hypothetical protein